MNKDQQHLDTLQDIREMMNRSSRFISLSGLSGIAAGICAIIATLLVWSDWQALRSGIAWEKGIQLSDLPSVRVKLCLVGFITFVVAVLLAYLFTWLRSRKTATVVWTVASRRLAVSVAIPLIAGGILVIRLLEWNLFGLIAPVCLLFYGIALINGSKYTLSEIKWLGFSQLIIGCINLWFIGYGLICWALGFGLMHIIYGTWMWWKYERI